MRRALLALLLLLALPAPAQRSVPQAMCGTWQYFTGGGGSGYSVARWFRLYPNGTYEYHGARDSSGPNGSVSASGSDHGTWWVEGNLQYARLCVHNSEGENLSFELELRNHPKTHDPMIVLDGDCYVTSTQRAPWPDL